LRWLRDQLVKIAGGLAGGEEAAIEILAVASRLRRYRLQLLGIAESLFARSAGGGFDREDVASQVRSAIERVITESIDPALQSLEMASRSGRRVVR